MKLATNNITTSAFKKDSDDVLPHLPSSNIANKFHEILDQIRKPYSQNMSE